MENEIRDVRLSFCCREDWDSFKSIDERTRFCQLCKNQVVDFTNATQSDFNVAMGSGKKICGRFKRSQMNEAFLKLAAASMMTVVSAGLVNCTDGKGVEPQVPRVQSIPFESFEEVKGEIVMGMPPPHINDSTHLWVVPKIVPDVSEAETNKR